MGLPSVRTVHSTARFVEDSRYNEVSVSTSVDILCHCGEDVTVYSNQDVICQGCGSEWQIQ